MPTKPTPQEMNANSGQILNAIRNELGGTYAANVPAVINPGEIMPNGMTASMEDSLQSLRAVGKALDTFQVHRNAFLDQLVNRIGRVILSSRLYRNPWSVFKKGFLEFGETVEEIFVNLAKAEQYNPNLNGAGVFKQRKPDVRARFHSMNYQKKYIVTVSRQQLKTAFLSWDGITDLLAKIIETLYSGANLDEFLMMKYTCSNAILNGQMAVKTIAPATLANADQIVSTMRELSQNLQYVDTAYNAAGVETYSDPAYQYSILTSAFSSVVDVGSLARAFNLEYTQFIGHTIGVNSFDFTPMEEQRVLDLLYPPELETQPENLFTADQHTMLQSVSAIVIDQNWFMIFDNFQDMLQVMNPDELYWNHFYHVWKTFSTSPFANAVALTTTTPTITSVTVTPSTIAAGTIPTTGGSAQLSATVAGTGLYNKGVTWSISDNDYATVSDTGLVSVSNYSGATSIPAITITATAQGDSTKTGTCTLNLTA